MKSRYLIKAVLIIPFLLLCLPHNALTLDGNFIGEKLIFPSHNNSVSLLNANIEINANDIEWDVVSQAIYLNTGKTTTVQFGFPKPLYPEYGIGIREFKTYLSNVLKKSYEKNAFENSKIKDLNYDRVYITNVKLPMKARCFIKHTYTVEMMLGSNGLNTLNYALKPGTLWKNSVNDISVSVNNVDTGFICRISPPGYTIEQTSIRWHFSQTDCENDINITWHYKLKNWIDDASQFITTQYSPFLIGEKLNEGENYITQCFGNDDLHNNYILLKYNQNTKNIVINTFKLLVDKYVSAGSTDTLKILFYKRFLYKFSDDKNALMVLYDDILKKLQSKIIYLDPEQLEWLSEDSSSYLENQQLALNFRKQLFNQLVKSANLQNIASAVCNLASSYADNKLYDKAIAAFGSIRTYTTKEEDLKYVIKEFAQFSRFEDSGTISIGIRKKANLGIIKLCRSKQEFAVYEFGALLRIAEIYENENRFKKALKIYEKINRTPYFSQEFKDRFVKNRLDYARTMTANESEPLPVNILKGIAAAFLLFLMIIFADKINIIYNVIRRIYRAGDRLLYSLWLAIAPLFKNIAVPLGSLSTALREQATEFIYTKFSESMLKSLTQIFSFIGRVIKTFANNCKLALKLLSVPVIKAIKLIPPETLGKIHTLVPLPSKEYYSKAFSIFKRQKEKILKVSGEITKNMIWSGEVIITGTTQINKDASVLIKPGTKLSFAVEGSIEKLQKEPVGNTGKCDLIVYGKFIAEGRERFPIIIAGENWGSIIFLGNKRGSIFKYCDISGGTDAIKCCGSIFLEISDSLIKMNSKTAINCCDNSALLIDNNEITDNGYCGILCSDTSSVEITSNRIYHNGTGIRCEGSSSPIIAKNSISEGNKKGIECLNKSAAKITGNTIQGNSEFGVSCSDGSKPKLKNNSIGNTLIGIECLNSAAPAIESNNIRACRIAVHCLNDSKAVINENTISSCNIGIDLGTTLAINVGLNKISGCIDTGIACYGPVKNAISDNSFTNNENGVHCHDDNNSEINKNRFKDCKVGINCNDFSVPQIKNNIFEENMFGVLCARTAAPVMTDNVIKGSKDSGVKSMDNSKPQIAFNTFENNKTAIKTAATSGAVIDDSNMYKDNAVKTEAISEEENKTGVQQAEEAKQQEPQGPLQKIRQVKGISLKRGDPAQAGETLVITALEQAIKFNFVDETFSNESLANIEIIADVLGGFTGLYIEINVHTDNTGNPVYNLELSKKVAKSLMEYFVYVRKFNPAMINYEGYGGAKPIASNDTDEGRYKNKRVEIILTKKPAM